MPRISKSYDPGILAYLKKPTNLPLVLQLGDYAAKIREDIPNEFWCNIVKSINASRPNLKLVGNPEFNPPTKADLGEEELNLQPSKPVTKNAHTLFFNIEMNKSDDEFYVYIGAKWQTPVKMNSKIYEMSEIIKLRDAMENDEDGYEFGPPWWLCGRYTWPMTLRDKFLSEYAEKKNQIVETTVTSYWRMARQHSAQLEKANKALQKFEKSRRV
jgi:hypothetical protein